MIPLSKTKAKYIKSLQLKKNRDKEKKFLVEGKKSILEFLNSNFKLSLLVGTKEFFDERLFPGEREEEFLAKPEELAAIGTLKTNNAALAIFHMAEERILSAETPGIILALDGINDPGNLGTIIRTADWFGINTVILNDSSVDPYNPKVINASKGSLSRVAVYRQPLVPFLSQYSGDVFAAEMYGSSLDTLAPIESGVIIMGNESHGISSAVEKYLTKKITIPLHGAAESLNVAVATGIICYMLTRKG